MAIQVETMVATLEAKIDKFERQMNKAARTGDREMRRIEKSADRLDTRLSKLGGGLKAFGGGLLAGVAAGGIGGIIAQIVQVANGIATIGDEARRAGLSSKAFQELKFVAEQNRIGVDSLVDGLKELNLRADEFIVTGQGSAAEAFRRLGYDAATLKAKLEDPSALFTEIIGKLEQLDQAAQIRIADEVFGGTGGERFVELIKQGERGIKATIDQAHTLGAVMSDQVIERAAELDRKFNAVATTVGTALKVAIVEAASALQRFIDQFYAFQDRNTDSLKTRMGELQSRRGQLTFGAPPGAMEAGFLKLMGKDAETELAAIDAEMAQIAAELRTRALPKLRAELLADNARRYPTMPPGGGGTGGSSSATNLAAAPRDAVDAWENLRDATVDYTGAQMEANNAAEEFGVVALDAGRALAGALSDGKLEAQELITIVIDLIQQLMRAQSIGGGIFGGVGSAVAGIVGSIFHDGGRVGAGAPTRTVNPAVFAGAPRYHKGSLGVGEMPAILKRGEIVDPGDGSVFRQMFGTRNAMQRIELIVTGAAGPEFIPIIKAQSRDVAVQVVGQGLKIYDKQLDKSIGGKVTMAKHRGYIP